MNDYLTETLKRVALDMGVAKIGIASPKNLAGPPEANPENILPGAKSVISYLALKPEDAIMKFLSKEDPELYRDHCYEGLQLLGRVGLALAEVLRSNGYQANPLSPNGVFARGSNRINGYKPTFSHRYAAVAAGVGSIGLSGNLMTPEFGSRVELSSLITDAELVPDRPLEENPCDECKMCLNSCPALFMSLHERVLFNMGGRQIMHAKRGIHIRCSISCVGYSGLSPDRKWSALAPSLIPIPDDDSKLMKLWDKIRNAAMWEKDKKSESPNPLKWDTPFQGYPENEQGVLARSRFNTRPTCGHCGIVCFETKQKRAKALKTLRNSGVVIKEERGKIQFRQPEMSTLLGNS